MKVVVLAALFGLSVSRAEAGQMPTERAARAYEQFMLGRHFAAADSIEAAITAYKRAMEIDPDAADIPAELAALYMRQNRDQDALTAAAQSLKVDPANREAHRVAGFVHAKLAESSRGNASRPRQGDKSDANLTKAIHHLEAASDKTAGEADPTVRATLAQLYLRTGAHAKAIPLLTDLIIQEPGWEDGPLLLAEAYSGAGRNNDAIAWLEQAAPGEPRLYATLAEFYERERRWRDAAGAYEQALRAAPRSAELKTRCASALMNIGAREDLAKARDILSDLLSSHPNDARALYLLSQTQRRLGDLNAAETTARRVITQNAKSPWGYYALAEALEERRQYQAVIDALQPVVAEARARGAGDSFQLGLLLPHVGFAYQELGRVDKALPIFEEAHRLSPTDPTVTGYLIQANIAAKKYAAAVELAQQARANHPDDLRLARLEAQALRQSGKADQGITLLENVVKAHDDDPSAYVALARLYSEAERGAQAVRLLQDAQVKFPGDQSIPFELGAILDKQKRFADAEAAFKQVLAHDPDNAPALNYLGYMLAERGERLDESVGYIKKALQLEPENGSYLDSLGWAYFKADQLDLAELHLRRAAEQLATNSVIQDHYGDVLFKRGRYDEAIAAWTQALAGDGDSIDRASIDRKIRSAKQKRGKK